MKCITNGKILLKDGILEGTSLLFEDKIVGFAGQIPSDAQVIDANGGWISPGLMDLHCHGFMGWDVSHADLDELRHMSDQMARWGVTAWLPTTMTLAWPDLENCFTTIRAAQNLSNGGDWQGAAVLGAHAEGPFISKRRKGAQAESCIQQPEVDKVSPWADVIRLMTVAPEVEGALNFIREAQKLGIVVSMGHTDAGTGAALAGIDAGIRHATHTFNAMPPLNHREPGALGAALADDRVYCELICDTFHVHPLLFGVMARLKGEHLLLITDAIQVSGLPDGIYDMAGEKVKVEGICCRFPDGTIAGSTLTMDRAVRNFRRYTSLPLWQIVNMASLNPARAIGVDHRKGTLEPGMDADILIADADFNVCATYVSGRQAFQAK